MKIILRGALIDVKNSDFLAGGGEGNIYVINGEAVKIYHNLSKMIDVRKINELKVLDSSNILGPRDVVYDKNMNPIGFVMPFIKSNEFLCKIFNKTFRDAHGVKKEQLINIAARIASTTRFIHSHRCLIVDANEFNFLLSSTLDEVYFIDVDSYQTPSFPATAIMDSVRDRKVQGNKFTELSDWFSVGVTMFQTIIGCHPYKMIHPDFSRRDWLKAMDQGISVFDKKSKLPPGTLPLSVLPRNYFRFFEAIFSRGERLAAPHTPGDVAPAAIAPAGPFPVYSNKNFEHEKIFSCTRDIVWAKYYNGTIYVCDGSSIFEVNSKNSREIVTNCGISNIILANNNYPLLLNFNKKLQRIKISPIGNPKEYVEIEAEDFYVSSNGNVLFTIKNGNLVSNIFSVFPKLIVMPNLISSISYNARLYEGIVCENLLGKLSLCFIYPDGGFLRCIAPQELNGHKVIDALSKEGYAILLTQFNGNFYLSKINNTEKKSSVSLDSIEVVYTADINISYKNASKVFVADKYNNSSRVLKVFNFYGASKEFDSPFIDDERLVDLGNDTCYIYNSGLFRLKSVKS